MSQSTTIKTSLKLEALYLSGVDNWQWFDVATEGYNLDNLSDEDHLAVLENGGVDNWVGYDTAMDLYHDLCAERLPSEDDSDPQSDPQPSASGQLRSSKRATAHFGEIPAGLWSRGTNPQMFDKAMKGGGSPEDVRNRLLDLLGVPA